MAQHAHGTPISTPDPSTPAFGSSTLTPNRSIPIPGLSTTQGAASLAPTTTRSYNLDKLTGPNYLTWATRMTLMLKRADLWNVVSDTTQSTATNNTEWTAKDLRAQAELMFQLGDPQVQMV